jgi:hypothetical protein
LIADSSWVQVGDVIMHRSIADYHSLLANAVSALRNDDAKVREELYERARAALMTEFKKLDPPPSEFDVLEERLKLNFAIHDVEWSSGAEIMYANAAEIVYAKSA